MGFLGDLGAPKIGANVNWTGVGNGVLIALGVLLIIIVVGIFTFVHYSNKIKKQQFKNKIHIFKEINGKPYPIDDDLARELYVPDTNVGLYFLKKRKIYVARPTRAMGKDGYWYKIRPNGEWINFDLESDESNLTKAKANYDQSGTKYAYINLKEIIKRNYKDKAIKWWKEYAPLITFIIVSFIFILGCIILLARIGKLIGQMGPMVEQWTRIADSMAKSAQSLQNLNSGIVTSG